MIETIDLQKMSWRQLFVMHESLEKKNCLSSTEKKVLDAINDELLEREEIEIMAGDLGNL